MTNLFKVGYKVVGPALEPSRTVFSRSLAEKRATQLGKGHIVLPLKAGNPSTLVICTPEKEVICVQPTALASVKQMIKTLNKLRASEQGYKMQEVTF